MAKSEQLHKEQMSSVSLRNGSIGAKELCNDGFEGRAAHSKVFFLFHYQHCTIPLFHGIGAKENVIRLPVISYS